MRQNRRHASSNDVRPAGRPQQRNGILRFIADEIT